MEKGEKTLGARETRWVVVSVWINGLLWVALREVVVDKCF